MTVEQKVRNLEGEVRVLKEDITYFKKVWADRAIDHDLLIKIESNVKILTDKMPNLVHKHEFEPVRKLVYGAASVILLAVVAALLTLVII